MSLLGPVMHTSLESVPDLLVLGGINLVVVTIKIMLQNYHAFGTRYFSTIGISFLRRAVFFFMAKETSM